MVKTNRLRQTLTTLLVLIGSAALIAACTDDLDWSGGDEPPGRPWRDTVIHAIGADATISLVGFKDCESDLSDLENTRREFREDQERRTALRMEEYAHDGWYETSDAADGTISAARAESGMQRDAMASAPQTDGDAAADASTAVTNDTSGDVVAGTNTVEDDVDEADIIKTDGRRMVTLRGNILRVTVLDDDPGIDGVLRLEDLGSNASMYLLDDTVTIISGLQRWSTYNSDTDAMMERGVDAPLPSELVLTQVDLSDPTDLSVIGSARIDGELASTRAIEGRIHVVMTNDSPEVLPRMSHSDGTTTNIGGCEDVRYETPLDEPPLDETKAESDQDLGPSRATGTTTGSHGSTIEVTATTIDGPTVSILSFTKLSDGIDPTVITGSGGIIYGSTESVYVASPLWDHGADGTAVHRFSLNSQGPVDYVGSAVVPGQPLNEFSLSEHDTTLRVVTMVEPFMIEPVRSAEAGAADIMTASQPTARSTRVTTLRTSDMGELGHLDGIAPGESLRAVRFIGSMGYVVTFQQVDPLFAIDLTDPADPVVLGELEIPGFSEYLHPVGDGLLLGIGRSIDPSTQRDEGLKISLFDVSDPHNPGELDAMTIRDGYSIVSRDHHAFTWDPVRRRAIIPVESVCGWSDTTIGSDGRMTTTSDTSPMPPLQSGMCSGALVVSTSDGQLSIASTVQHRVGDMAAAMPDRAVIVGENLWTLSDLGLGVSHADDPAAVNLIGFD